MKRLSKISQSQKGKHDMMPLEVPRVVKFIETEGRMMIAGAREEKDGMQTYCLMDMEFQFRKMKKCSEDGRW